MGEDMVETVDVPEELLRRVLSTLTDAAVRLGGAVIDDLDAAEEFGAALDEVWRRPLLGASSPGVRRLSAASVFWLAEYARAELVYELECPAMWEHPAVRAERALFELVEREAPGAYGRLRGRREEIVAGWPAEVSAP